ncbi:fimbrial chaperone [Ramlibacter monticola]|uniref:Fimbria/pilus periplasmic chaperone n=1 Tax=Ramlibacter monticola TaxID=1926872 RepID=A0A937CV92_9BURK|nr:fimbria/pilus periplasmic chaperone [Ramlibacter monticola]MBL0394455.1 fimbria/pilus periplasmic chaperone [Ramlibacter monticola]
MNGARLIRYGRALALLGFGLAAVLHAQASVVIAGTRVIYNAKERELTVKLSNEGQLPALTQVWLDKGDPSASPATISVPFTVTPPVARIDPAKAQTLRIFYTGEPLPQDRESVFWLNVLEVPPKAKEQSQGETNKLQLAFRTRIKLFFRPAGLTGSAQEAPAQIEWRLRREGGQTSLEARNPTPYFVSFASLEVAGPGASAKLDQGGMVGPGETKKFPLSRETPAGALKLRYQAINDYGGAITGESLLH